jgi:tryptophan-rich sensory protein
LRLALQVALFLTIYLPSVVIFSSLQQRYDLMGVEALVTFYAGTHYASGQFSADTDGAGWADAVQRFGPPENYHNSLIRFTMAHPLAVHVRFKQNLKNLRALMYTASVFNIYDFLAFLAFSSILVFARPPSIGRLPLVGYVIVLILASPYFLVFHTDPRYTLLLVLCVVIGISITSLVFWTWVGSRVTGRGRILFLLPTIGLVVLCATRLEWAINKARDANVDLTPWQQLATNFRDNVGPEGTPVVGYYAPDGTSISGGDQLWLSYYARTAVGWCGSPNCEQGNMMPRTRIYSYLGKPMQYIWMPDELVLKHQPQLVPPGELIVQHVPITSHGLYSLIKLK